MAEVYFFLHQTIHIKKEKGLTVQLISYSVHGKSMFFDAHPVLPVSQSAVNTYVHTIITFLVTASSMKPAELIKVFFFVIFCHLVSSTRAMRRRYGGQEGWFRNRGRVPKLILLMIFFV